MRRIAVIAAALLAAPAAEAQADCRGDTLSELNACVAASRQQGARQPAAQGGAVARVPAARPANVGGAVQPRNLRATPPVARSRATAPAPGEVAAEDAQEVASPESFGLVRDGVSDFYEVDGRFLRVDRRTREVLEVLPMDDTVAEPDRLVPGTVVGR